MAENETIALASDGGLTGRGIGSLRIVGARLVVNGQHVRDLSALEMERLAALVQAVGDFKGARQAPDAVRYRLRAGERTLSWSDVDDLPRPAQKLFEALLKLFP